MTLDEAKERLRYMLGPLSNDAGCVLTFKGTADGANPPRTRDLRQAIVIVLAELERE